LERIVLLYLELQFPLSAISLRFAARILPQSGLKEELFFQFEFFQSEFISDTSRHFEECGNLLFFNRKGRKDLRKVRKVFLPRITQIISNFLFYYPLFQQQQIPISYPFPRKGLGIGTFPSRLHHCERRATERGNLLMATTKTK
jgi:hypothetical protein